MEVLRAEVARLKLMPGDHLVIKIAELIPYEMAAKIKEELSSILPMNSKVILLDGGADLDILTVAQKEALCKNR